MSNVINPDGTHKIIAGYSHAAGLQERDRLIAEQATEIKRLKGIEEAAKRAVSQQGVTYPIPASGAWAMIELAEALYPVKRVPHEKGCASLNTMLLSDPPQPAACNCRRGER